MESEESIVVGDVVSGLQPNELAIVRRFAPATPVTISTLQTRHRRQLLTYALRSYAETSSWYCNLSND
jgi:hypothetical protein